MRVLFNSNGDAWVDAVRYMSEKAGETLDKVYHDVLCDPATLIDGEGRARRREQIFAAINAMPAPPVRCLGVIADCPGCGAPAQVGTCRYCGRIMV